MKSARDFLISVQSSGYGQSIASMFTLPTIGLPTAFSLGNAEFMTKFKAVEKVLASLGLLRGIPIYASSQKEIGENNIGQQVLIRASEIGTQVVTDNIAPLPRTWEIEGYIGAKPGGYNASALGSFAGTESWKETIVIPSINVGVSNFNTLVFLQAVKDYFRYLRVLRAPFQFITKEGTVVDVLMQNYTFADEPNSAFATKISMKLMEYVALTVEGEAYAIKNTPGIGSAYGVAAKYSTATSKVLNSSLKLLTSK